jgi:hypothetical protein
MSSNKIPNLKFLSYFVMFDLSFSIWHSKLTVGESGDECDRVESFSKANLERYITTLNSLFWNYTSIGKITFSSSFEFPNGYRCYLNTSIVLPIVVDTCSKNIEMQQKETSNKNEFCHTNFKNAKLLKVIFNWSGNDLFLWRHSNY